MTKKEITARLNQEFDNLMDNVKYVAVQLDPESTPAEVVESCKLTIGQQNGIIRSARALGVDFQRLPADTFMVKLWRENPQATRR